jgi:hypothetical protein
VVADGVDAAAVFGRISSQHEATMRRKCVAYEPGMDGPAALRHFATTR